MIMSNDTHPKIEQMQIAGLRKMTLTQKAELLASLNRAAFQFCTAGIRNRHGAIDSREMRLREASLRLARETMIRVFAWDPCEKGY